jgi:uncharacterized protein YkwD
LYDYKDTMRFQPETGHFTQIVWRETTKVGFGFAQSEDGRFYAVANYSPAGNYKFEFERNVLPAININSLLAQKLLAPAKPPSAPPTNETSDDYDEEGESSHQPFHQERGVDVGGAVGVGREQNAFINEALHIHNACRQKHGSEPLTLNAELCRIAQSHALYLARTKSLMHSTNTYRAQKLGENLAYSYDSRLSYYPGETATMQWYNEIKDYNFDGDYQKGTGHFTQVSRLVFFFFLKCLIRKLNRNLD